MPEGAGREMLGNTGDGVHMRSKAGVRRVVRVFEERAVVHESVVHEHLVIADADVVGLAVRVSSASVN